MSDANADRWRQPIWVVLVTAIIAAAAPSTAAVHGWLNKAKEIEIAQRDQNFRIRTGLIDRAVDQKLPANERERLFRFLAASDEDKALKAWARQELEVIGDETKKLRSMLGSAEGALAEADKRSADLKRKLATSQAANRGAEEAKVQLADARRAYETANAQIGAIKAALGDVTPERLELIRSALAIVDDPSLRPLLQAASRTDRKAREELGRLVPGSERDRQTLRPF